MGKVKKVKPSQTGKNISLGEQIESDKSVKNKNRSKQRFRQDEDEEVRMLIRL